MWKPIVENQLEKNYIYNKINDIYAVLMRKKNTMNGFDLYMGRSGVCLFYAYYPAWNNKYQKDIENSVVSLIENAICYKVTTLKELTFYAEIAWFLCHLYEKKQIVISDKFLIRTPKNSFNQLKTYCNESLEVLLSKTDIQEAIRIASFDLYEKLKKLPALESKEKERAKNSLIRYMNRTSTRCTPFGLFAGCALGIMDEYTHLTISSKIRRHTRLDMNYLCSLSQYLAAIPEIKYKLKYYPNNTLYTVGNEYRYIEYQYVKDIRIHQISSVKKTYYLDKIIQISQTGVSIENLYPYITNEDIQKEVFINYIDSLIQSQVLISELDPAITGDDCLTRMISILDSIHITYKYSTVLSSLRNLLTQIDTSGEELLNKYIEIENIVKSIGAPFNSKYLFQVDVNNVFVNNTIGVSVKKRN